MTVEPKTSLKTWLASTPAMIIMEPMATYLRSHRQAFVACNVLRHPGPGGQGREDDRLLVWSWDDWLPGQKGISCPASIPFSCRIIWRTS